MNGSSVLRKHSLKNVLSIFESRLFSSAPEATFETKPFKLHKLEKVPVQPSPLSSEDAMKYYNKCKLFDE
ncbi:unnamed protein product [Macrosiphum euphorbiae]|uniref:Uncharacterized protein n=1 Tax=Macrosiphum euphorbiae TaxID=13131 RepID=A0AAV0X228_9HEMI|nr:unnamed protein product [Macrosiphum euphorbiae]